jgi:hypothetical protein
MNKRALRVIVAPQDFSRDDFVPTAIPNPAKMISQRDANISVLLMESS